MRRSDLLQERPQSCASTGDACGQPTVAAQQPGSGRHDDPWWPLRDVLARQILPTLPLLDLLRFAAASPCVAACLASPAGRQLLLAQVEVDGSLGTVSRTSLALLSGKALRLGICRALRAQVGYRRGLPLGAPQFLRLPPTAVQTCIAAGGAFYAVIEAAPSRSCRAEVTCTVDGNTQAMALPEEAATHALTLSPDGQRLLWHRQAQVVVASLGEVDLLEVTAARAWFVDGGKALLVQGTQDGNVDQVSLQSGARQCVLSASAASRFWFPAHGDSYLTQLAQGGFYFGRRGGRLGERLRWENAASQPVWSDDGRVLVCVDGCRVSTYARPNAGASLASMELEGAKHLHLSPDHAMRLTLHPGGVLSIADGTRRAPAVRLHLPAQADITQLQFSALGDNLLFRTRTEQLGRLRFGVDTFAEVIGISESEGPSAAELQRLLTDVGCGSGDGINLAHGQLRRFSTPLMNQAARLLQSCPSPRYGDDDGPQPAPEQWQQKEETLAAVQALLQQALRQLQR